MAYVTSDSYDGRYFRFTVTQSGTSTKVNWTLTVAGGSSAYYGTTAITCKINGTTVKSYSAQSYTSHTFPVAKGSVSGTYDVGRYGSVSISLAGRPYYASSTTKTGSVTLTAPTYTITLVDGGVPNGTKNYDVDYILPAPVERDGWLFQGWQDAGGTLRNAGYAYTTNAAATFTAKWLEATWNLTFSGGLGTLSNPTLELPVTYGSTTNNSLAGKQSSSKELGYVLKNWLVGTLPIYDSLGNYIVGTFWDEDGKFKYSTEEDEILATANWVPNEYYVDFYTCPSITGGFINTAGHQVAYQTDIPFGEIVVAEPSGYQFTGYWTTVKADALVPYVAEELPESAVNTATLDSPSDISYYAVYKDVAPSSIEFYSSGHMKLGDGISLSTYCDNVYNSTPMSADPNGKVFGFFRFVTNDRRECKFDESTAQVVCLDHLENIISQYSVLIKYYNTEAIIAFKIDYEDIEDTYYVSIEGLKDYLGKSVGRLFELNIVPATLLIDINETRIHIGRGKKAPDDNISAVTSYSPIVLKDEDESRFNYELIQVDEDNEFNLLELITEGINIKPGLYYLPAHSQNVTMHYGPAESQVYTFDVPAIIEVINGRLARVRRGIINTETHTKQTGFSGAEFYIALDRTFPELNFIKYPDPIVSPESNLRWEWLDGVHYLDLNEDNNSANENGLYLTLAQSSPEGPVYWADILNKPSTFPPSTHTHADKQDKTTLEADVKAFINANYIQSLLDNAEESSF